VADESVVERFRAWLREHDLPVTAQRLAIAEIVLEQGTADRHLSAEEIALELSARGGKAGTATVYRTLDVLVASGLVVERDFAEGFRRFEPARERTEQEHLLCTTCGQVGEFHDERVGRLVADAAASREFATERYRLVIYGTCAQCRQGAAQKPRAEMAHS